MPTIDFDVPTPRSLNKLTTIGWYSTKVGLISTNWPRLVGIQQKSVWFQQIVSTKRVNSIWH